MTLRAQIPYKPGVHVPDNSPANDDPATRLGDSVIAVLNVLDELRADAEKMSIALKALRSFIDELLADLIAAHQWKLLHSLLDKLWKHDGVAHLDHYYDVVICAAIQQTWETRRTDAACHPDSILDYNGRSLDSHNPWHLHFPVKQAIEHASTLMHSAVPDIVDDLVLYAKKVRKEPAPTPSFEDLLQQELAQISSSDSAAGMTKKRNQTAHLPEHVPRGVKAEDFTLMK